MMYVSTFVIICMTATVFLCGMVVGSSSKTVRLYDDCTGDADHTVNPGERYTLIIDGSNSSASLACLVEFHAKDDGVKLYHKFTYVSIVSWDVSITVYTRSSAAANRQIVAYYTITAGPTVGAETKHERYLAINFGRLFGTDFSVKVEIWTDDGELQSWQISLIVTGCVGLVLGIALIITIVMCMKSKGASGKVLSMPANGQINTTTAAPGSYPLSTYPMTTNQPTRAQLYPSNENPTMPAA